MEDILKKLYKDCLKAYKKNEIPVSCIILDKNNNIISREINNRQRKNNIIGHAEINAIIKAEKKIKDWRLNNYIMIVSLKPCEMCQKIIEESRLDKIYYLVDQPNIKENIKNLEKINHKIYENKISTLLSSFFKLKR